MKKNNIRIIKIVLFLSILCLAAFLRLYKLNQVPPGVNRDEASIGYTAYSLIQTGKDEYGKSFPFSFQSFGDWKLPLYIYTTIPFVKIFGLTETAVRLPSAIAGIATIALTYFLTQYLFNSLLLSFLSMVLLAISPWHIHLSRVESESNLAVLFTVTGLLLFFHGIKKRPKLLMVSALFFALPFFTYHGNHVTTTLFLIGLVYIFRSTIPKNIWTGIAGILFVFLVGFILSRTFQQADKTKLSGISIFGSPVIVHERIELPRNQHDNSASWNARLFHNRIVYAIETTVQNYLMAFSPEFLFIKGGTNHAHNIENFGNLYLVEAPFFYIGIVLLFLHRKEKNWMLLLWWLMIAPVAASITKDAPHSNRMFAIYPIPALIAALGIRQLFKSIPKRQVWRIGSACIILIMYSFNVGIYLDRYYTHFPKNEEAYWGNGYAALYKTLSSPKFANKRVIMSHPEYSPYIFFLFYSKFNPKIYQETAVRYPPTEDAFVHVQSYDRYVFRAIQWDKDIHQPNTILVDLPKDVPPPIEQTPYRKEQIVSNGGFPLFTLVETQ